MYLKLAKVIRLRNVLANGIIKAKCLAGFSKRLYIHIHTFVWGIRLGLIKIHNGYKCSQFRA